MAHAREEVQVKFQQSDPASGPSREEVAAGGSGLSTGLLVGEETARETLESRPRPRVCPQPLCCVACRSLFLWGHFVSAQVADPDSTGCMPGTVLVNLILTMTPVRKTLRLPTRAVRLLVSLESDWLRPQSCCVQSWNLNPRP